jgi:type VI secretion system protein ImpN
MSVERPQQALQEIAARFSALWQALSQDGDAPREPGETRLLVDRVRDALDRRRAGLDETDVGFVANSFVLEGLVHQGVYTQVHRLRHRDLQTLHALKTLRPDHADNAIARDLLLREARLTLALRHPHVVNVQTALRLPDGRPALLFEWMPDSLSDRMNEGTLSLQDVHGAMTAILSGLEAIHASRLVHADISPDNLLLTGSGLKELKIADFGIALENGESHADLGLAAAGHTGFAAPEQTGGGLDCRADLYACGRILKRLLERSDVDSEARKRLADLAEYLAQRDRESRPENASAALRLLNEIEH